MSFSLKQLCSTLGRGAAVVLSFALAAGTASAAGAPAPNTHTVTVGGQTKTYANLPGAPASNDASTAYQFRTRVLVGQPGCQRFATDADNAFIDEKMDTAAKAAALKKIGADAAAAGCLGN